MVCLVIQLPLLEVKLHYCCSITAYYDLSVLYFSREYTAPLLAQNKHYVTVLKGLC